MKEVFVKRGEEAFRAAILKPYAIVDPGVIDNAVDPPKAADGLFHHRLALARLRQVAGNE